MCVFLCNGDLHGVVAQSIRNKGFGLSSIMHLCSWNARYVTQSGENHIEQLAIHNYLWHGKVCSYKVCSYKVCSYKVCSYT